MEKNNCYECPMRGEVAGSAHSSCSLLGDMMVENLTALAVGSGNLKSIKINDEPVVKFDPYGVASGWCTWPINFDPVWVECKLDMEKIKMLHEQRKSNDRSINQQT